ncbi:glycosyltransferase family 4 protein [Aeromonas caviae]|uniref:glycosyltransferase family 4 protein n=1 Tax=Aeromonas caviae TaxID=648 RepID=UPI002B484F45|nr:glycosyltransferase family 4 protein [Aeromonas caviae]
MKVLLVSINSIDENTGGGIYLRSLINLYKMSGVDINVISKGGKGARFTKSWISDIFGRCILIPSYMGAFVLRILISSRKADVIAFHSSRLGGLAWLVKSIYPCKKVIVHTDNIECDLILTIKGKGNLLKRAVSRLDAFLIPLSESVMTTKIDVVTFITKQDEHRYEQVYGKVLIIKEILPVMINGQNVNSDFLKEDVFLFTGSFDFYPNQEALIKLITIADNNKRYKFFVAGRGLSEHIKVMRIELPGNISFFSDVSTTDMDALYRRSKYFICPVSLGSGMKTKIAEALSYGLQVIAHSDSTFGYEDAVESKVVIPVNDDFFLSTSNSIMSLSYIVSFLEQQDRYLPLEVFNCHYNINSGLGKIQKVLR